MVYNSYVVDRSVINLRIAVDQLAYADSTEDFQRIKPLLKVQFMGAMSPADLPTREFLALVAAQNIIDTGKDREQISDVSFFLKDVLALKEKERGGFLSALDRINELIFKPQIESDTQKLQAQAKSLSEKVRAIRDPDAKQEGLYRLENTYIALLDLEMAQRVMEELLVINPKSEIAQKAKFNLAWAFNNSGEFEKAIDYFNQVAKEALDLKLSITSEYQIADVLYKKGDYEASRDRYALLADKYPEYEGKAMAYYNAAQISFNELQDYRAALEYFHQYAIMQSGYISYFNLDEFNEAMLYFDELAGEEANYMEKFRDSVENTRVDRLRNQGYSLLRSKEYPMAIDTFQKALYIDPSDGMSIIGKGLGYYWEGQGEMAQREAIKAIDLVKGSGASEDEDESVLTNAIFIFINSKDSAGAIYLGEKFLVKKRIEGEEIEAPEFYYNLAYAYILEGDMKKAAEYLEKSISMKREFTLAHNNLGCAYWVKKDYSKALASFKIATVRNDKLADAHFNLGIAHYYLNRLDDAYEHFKNALLVDPSYQRAEHYMRRIEEELRMGPEVTG
ncbi:MAG: tetratricopeptide repeat protein [Candidatus Omnitrophica bacterium]|nr:tetratricopeptide repeat protein [Candidatus Omnitrophota bacterium]